VAARRRSGRGFPTFGTALDPAGPATIGDRGVLAPFAKEWEGSMAVKLLFAGFLLAHAAVHLLFFAPKPAA